MRGVSIPFDPRPKVTSQTRERRKRTIRISSFLDAPFGCTHTHTSGGEKGRPPPISMIVVGGGGGEEEEDVSRCFQRQILCREEGDKVGGGQEEACT